MKNTLKAQDQRLKQKKKPPLGKNGTIHAYYRQPLIKKKQGNAPVNKYLLSGLLDWGYSQDISLMQDTLLEVWHRFHEGENLENTSLRPVIHEAWKRCRIDGIDHNLDKAPTLLDHLATSSPDEAELLQEAQPALSGLAQTLTGYDTIAALCNPAGRIMAIEGDPDFAGAVAEHKNFRVGAHWAEKTTGNNAIGTALSTGRPHQVFSSEHYCRGWHDYICTAVPITDPFSEKILGVLDLTGSISNFHRHAYGQLLHVVRIIESALFRKGLAREYLFNREVLQTLQSIRSEAIAIADARGAIRACTAAVAELLGSNAEPGRAALGGLAETLLAEYDGNLPAVLETRLTIGKESFLLVVRPLRHDQVLLGLEIRFSTAGTPALPTIKPSLPNRNQRCPIIGASQALTAARQRAEKAASFTSTVLLEGESGTGKELFARLIHHHSPRAGGPFIPLNCAAIAPDLIASELFGYDGGAFTGARAAGRKGKLELGSGGTIFLDEISEMPLAVQVILLRFLQEKEFYRVGGTHLVQPDVRIIAATNKPLREEMAAGRFRTDLFYRLNVITIELPPLRRRPEDIPPLVEHFLDHLQRETGQPPKRLDEGAWERLRTHTWPGNVRELQNVIEHAFIMGESELIRAADLPCQSAGPESSPLDVQPPVGRPQTAGRSELLAALNDCGWNISRTARRLGISRATLYRHLKRHDIPLTR